MSLPCIQIVHYNITVVLGLKWHSYLMCEHTSGANEKYLQKLNFFSFHPYFFTFPKFSLYSNISGIE